MHTQSVTTRRRCGRKSKHEAARELSAHRSIGIAASQVESKVSRVARGEPPPAMRESRPLRGVRR